MNVSHSSQTRTLSSTASIQDSLSGKLFVSVAASALVAVCAHISLPLPFTPVPLTLGNMAVLMVGLMLGPSTAFAALALYLAEGALGLPVFAPSGPGGLAQLLGPTAGYLFSYPFAAAVASTVVRSLKPTLSRFNSAVVACVLASVVIFTLGAGWLASLPLHLGLAAILHMAVLPFLPGEALKIAAAAGIFSALQRARRS